MPQGMKCSFWSFAPSPFKLNGSDYIGSGKDLGNTLAYSPSACGIRIRYKRNNKALSFIY
jgi:hypothetical protein